MAVKKKAAVSGGRQAAYAARNRAALVKAGQEVLAEIGPSATIEQLAGHAQVSPTTIYKYFENKDELFIQAIAEMWISWLQWSSSERAPGTRLEMTLDTGRKLFWARKTHPLFANMLHNSLEQMPNFLILSDKGEGRRVFSELAASGELKQDDFDQRYILWTNTYTGLLKSVFVYEEISPADANIAFGIGLSVWGISEAKAKKIISRPLSFAPVK
jgi:AcrR family transcriptional regulator